MRRKRLLWQFYPSYVLITTFALMAVIWYSTSSLQNFYHKKTYRELEAQARLLEKPVLQRLSDGEELKSFCQNLTQKISTRLTVIDPLGKVLGDSHEDPGRMDNHGQRPEVEKAFQGKVGTSIRFSRTLKDRRMYVAVPLFKKDKLKAVIRTSLSLQAIDRASRSITLEIALGGVVIAILAALASLVVYRRISIPMFEIKKGALRFARGDFSSRLPVSEIDEIGALAEVMNQMADQLEERIKTIVEQRNEHQAVLSSMVEGVIAVDQKESIINVNQAARNFLGITLEEVKGRGIVEVVRNTDLQKLVGEVLSQKDLVERDIVIHHPEDRILQARGVVLRDGEGRRMGALLALNDVTRLRRLERLRQSFVANVSHELKTPITSIKGFIETLQEGALKDPDQAEKFLQIIARQTERLHLIIEDLLSLSRIEQESEAGEVTEEEVSLEGILENAIVDCHFQAREEDVVIERVINVDEGRTISVNPSLFEQALVNLLDNAIKYGKEGGKVILRAREEGENLVIEVEDFGPGISNEHLDRLFERFYRVDKGRSRQMGGTGLGLAIVKHIIRAHKGQIEVKSALGKGTVFSIYLPETSQL